LTGRRVKIARHVRAVGVPPETFSSGARVSPRRNAAILRASFSHSG